MSLSTANGEIVVGQQQFVVSAVFSSGRNDGDERTLYVSTSVGIVRYNYAWQFGSVEDVTSPTEGPKSSEEPTRADFINLKGVAVSAEGKPMYWMHLSAQVFYGQEQYEEGKRPDAEYRCLVDTKGAYSLKIPMKQKGTMSSLSESG